MCLILYFQWICSYFMVAIGGVSGDILADLATPKVYVKPHHEIFFK